jgi:hypothetical protein
MSVVTFFTWLANIHWRAVRKDPSGDYTQGDAERIADGIALQ